MVRVVKLVSPSNQLLILVADLKELIFVGKITVVSAVHPANIDAAEALSECVKQFDKSIVVNALQFSNILSELYIYEIFGATVPANL